MQDMTLVSFESEGTIAGRRRRPVSDPMTRGCHRLIGASAPIKPALAGTRPGSTIEWTPFPGGVRFNEVLNSLPLKLGRQLCQDKLHKQGQDPGNALADSAWGGWLYRPNSGSWAG